MAIALLVPGSASTGDFLQRAFAPVLTGLTAVVITDVSGDAARLADHIELAVEEHNGDPVALMVGMSVGAHAVGWWASRQRQGSTAGAATRAQLVLAMPAWTGAPGSVATATADAVQRLARAGVPSELARLTSMFPDDWVVAELVRAWTAIPFADLLTSLAGTAASRAPDVGDLARIHHSTVVLTLTEDPLHPAAVGKQWAATIPGALLATVGRAEPAEAVEVFGRRVQPLLNRLSAAHPAAVEPEPRHPAAQPAPQEAG